MWDRLIELLGNAEKSIFGKIVHRERTRRALADYLLAEGVIVPPCKVGDIIWIVYTPKWPANPADKGKWFMMEDGVQRIIYGTKGLSIETWNVGTIPAKDIEKKLFFTKEEAEKALAEKEKNND